LSTETLSAAQITGRATELIKTLRSAYQESQQLKRENASKITELGRLLKNKLTELATIYLPNIVPATTEAILPLTGFRAFSLKSPNEELHARRDTLSRRIAEIEKDPLYVNRQQLIDPIVGEHTLAKEKVGSQKELIDQSVSRFESLEGFLDLLERNYDTPDYNVSKLSLQYYRDWKRGDEIEDSFISHGKEGEKIRPSFSDLAYQYRQVKQAADNYQSDIDRLDREIGKINGLVAEREEALRSLTTLADDVLAEARARLLDHVQHADRADLAERAKDRPEILATLKHIEGLEKKTEYLEALTRQYVDSDAEALLDRIASLEKKAIKYSRPKNRSARVPASDAERWLKDPTPKLRQRWGRYHTSHTTIYSFNRYDNYDFFSNYLWWDVMTDGRLDGNFIPEVSDYRATNPEATSHYQFSEATQGGGVGPALSEMDFS
jgi:hypothetical protein